MRSDRKRGFCAPLLGLSPPSPHLADNRKATGGTFRPLSSHRRAFAKQPPLRIEGQTRQSFIEPFIGRAFRSVCVVPIVTVSCMESHPPPPVSFSPSRSPLARLPSAHSLIANLPPPSPSLFPELFCKIVSRHPERIAVSTLLLETPGEQFAGRAGRTSPLSDSPPPFNTPSSPSPFSSLYSETSYEELLRLGLHIAGFLHSHGIGREDLVALVMPKSHLFIASILGSWFVGAAFVPLDPGQSEAKLLTLLRAAPVKAIITRYEPLSLPDVPCFSIAEVIAHPTPLTAPAPLSPQSLAYLLFTAGSGGDPLGVLIEHGGLCAILQAQRDILALAPGDNFFWFVSHIFDASIANIGATLLSGATLHIPGIDTQESTLSQLAEMRARNITHTVLPPSLLPALSLEEIPDSLKTVVIGGEVCPPPCVQKWASRVRLINAYGLPEATICATMVDCSPEWNTPYIGEPLPGVLLRIVDDEDQEVLPGEAGELWIGGVGVARAYHNQPLLNQQRFLIADGQRWHSTGDLVVAHPDGKIAFIGRLDRQIKRRGILIQPEEIERAMLAQSGVRRAAVVERTLEGLTDADANGSTGELVGFYEMQPGGPSPEELRLHLKARLPEWMIPRRLIVLDDIPRTATAKTNLEALEAMPLDSHERVLPADPELRAITRLLRSCWGSVLGLTEVPSDVSFFHLGEGRVALPALIAAAHKRGLPLTTQLVEEAPTLEAQCRALKALNVDRHSHQWRRISEEAAHLPRVLFSSSYFASQSPKEGAIFITGASGAFGAHLLASLLSETTAPLVCIARGPHAKRRFEASIARFGVPGIDLNSPRLRVVAGDLQLYRFGLTRDDWSMLASSVTSIIHCGATVNLVSPFDALVPANIGSTRSVVELAILARAHITYLSSLAVFTHDKNPPPICDEDDPLETPRQLRTGYAATKVASERLLRNACAMEGIPLAIMRPGPLIGDTIRHTDSLPLLVRGLVQLGMIPEDIVNQCGIDAIPVSTATGLASQIAQSALHGTFHLSHPTPIPLSTLYSAITRQHSVDIVSRAQFTSWMEDTFDDELPSEAQFARDILLSPDEATPLLMPRHLSISQRTRGNTAPIASIAIPSEEEMVDEVVEKCLRGESLGRWCLKDVTPRQEESR